MPRLQRSKNLVLRKNKKEFEYNSLIFFTNKGVGSNQMQMSTRVEKVELE